MAVHPRHAAQMLRGLLWAIWGVLLAFPPLVIYLIHRSGSGFASLALLLGTTAFWAIYSARNEFLYGQYLTSFYCDRVVLIANAALLLGAVYAVHLNTHERSATKLQDTWIESRRRLDDLESQLQSAESWVGLLQLRADSLHGGMRLSDEGAVSLIRGEQLLRRRRQSINKQLADTQKWLASRSRDTGSRGRADTALAQLRALQGRVNGLSYEFETATMLREVIDSTISEHPDFRDLTEHAREFKHRHELLEAQILAIRNALLLEAEHVGLRDLSTLGGRLRQANLKYDELQASREDLLADSRWSRLDREHGSIPVRLWHVRGPLEHLRATIEAQNGHQISALLDSTQALFVSVVVPQVVEGHSEYSVDDPAQLRDLLGAIVSLETGRRQIDALCALYEGAAHPDSLLELPGMLGEVLSLGTMSVDSLMAVRRSVSRRLSHVHELLTGRASPELASFQGTYEGARASVESIRLRHYIISRLAQAGMLGERAESATAAREILVERLDVLSPLALRVHGAMDAHRLLAGRRGAVSDSIASLWHRVLGRIEEESSAWLERSGKIRFPEVGEFATEVLRVRTRLAGISLVLSGDLALAETRPLYYLVRVASRQAQMDSILERVQKRTAELREQRDILARVDSHFATGRNLLSQCAWAVNLADFGAHDGDPPTSLTHKDALSGYMDGIRAEVNALSKRSQGKWKTDGTYETEMRLIKELEGEVAGLQARLNRRVGQYWALSASAMACTLLIVTMGLRRLAARLRVRDRRRVRELGFSQLLESATDSSSSQFRRKLAVQALRLMGPRSDADRVLLVSALKKLGSATTDREEQIFAMMSEVRTEDDMRQKR